VLLSNLHFVIESSDVDVDNLISGTVDGGFKLLNYNPYSSSLLVLEIEKSVLLFYYV
jgi:hypothetical protein